MGLIMFLTKMLSSGESGNDLLNKARTNQIAFSHQGTKQSSIEKIYTHANNLIRRLKKDHGWRQTYKAKPMNLRGNYQPTRAL